MLNSLWDAEETKNSCRFYQTYPGRKENQSYIINATQIAEEIGLGNRTNTILQSAFFKLPMLYLTNWQLRNEAFY